MPGNAAQTVAVEPVAGSDDRFAELVHEHQAMVFSIALRYLGDRALAEEVAQDVFLELYQTLDSLQSPVHIRHWLRRVASHRSIDQSRRRKIRPQLGLQDVPEPAGVNVESDALRDAVLQRLVAALPERCRMVVVLRYQEDLDPMEIADILGIPAQAVRSRLHKGLTLLRRKMTAFGAGGQS